MDGYGMATGGANAFMQFLQGVQEGRQKREQKQRQQQYYEMLQQQMQAGQVRPQAKMSPEGGMSYSFPFVEPEQPYQAQTDVQVPEGYEISAYDVQGRPRIEKKRIVSDSAKVLKEDKAAEELRRRKAVRQPLDTRIPQPKKGGWFGIGSTKVNEETTTFAKTIKTRQDLLNRVKNAGALEEQGVNISAIEDLYNDELLKLAQEGYLSEK